MAMADLHHDIERYLRGEMTPQEQHALERRALDDPFLRDALEGASSVQLTDFSNDLVKLKAELAKRTTKSGGARIVPLYWPLRIAAAVLLIAASAYLAYLMVPHDGTGAEQLAKNEAVPQPDSVTNDRDSAAAQGAREDDDQLTLEKQAQENAGDNAPQRKPIDRPAIAAADSDENEQEQPAPAATQPPVHPAEKLAEAEESKADDVVRTETAKEAKAEPKAGLADRDKARAAAPPVAKKADGITYLERKDSSLDSTRAESMASAPSAGYAIISKQVKGKVTDEEDGDPLPGVNVFVKGTSIGAVTNVDGEFEIAIPTGNTTLIFSFIGLQSKEVPIVTDKQMNVAMSPDVSQLSEVVVVGYGTEGFLKPKEEETFELAEPAGGRRAYKRYLDQNLTYPEVALENSIEGKVTIQFTVEATGQLSDFKILRSLGYGCDEEVIRLIKAGPKWNPTKRNEEPIKGKVKVRLKFQLPEKKKKK